MNLSYLENSPCDLPATREQSNTGATNQFMCDPPRLAEYVSLDIDTSRPEVTYDQAFLQLAEVTVEEYTIGECTTNVGKVTMPVNPSPTL